LEADLDPVFPMTVAPLDKPAQAPATQTVVVIAGYAPSLVNFRGPMLEAMVKLGHRVIACAPDADPATTSRLEAMGVVFCQVPISRVGMNPLRDLLSLAGLTRVLRQLAPDVVFAYTAKPVIYGTLAARLAGVPKRFAMITGLGYAFAGQSFFRKVITQIVQFLYRLALAGNHRVFFQNPDDERLFVDRRLVRAEQVQRTNGSGIDLQHFAVAPFPCGHPVFLLVARLLGDKGIREYAEAARIVRRTHPEARFQLVGWYDEANPNGLPRAEVEAWVREGVIDYLGPSSDVRRVLENAHVYVLPSYREGTPRTVLEAMAMGRPILTTNAPGCRETVVEGVNGYLVPVMDSVKLAESMKNFLTDPDTIHTMGKASRRLAEDKYDVHQVNAVILNTLGL
jgi:glycosyltransferase involved in cell wall biosynthesis